MSNGVKRSITARSAPWRSLMLSVVGLAAITAFLPSPTTFGALVRGGAAPAELGGPAGAAVLLVASAVVWPLLAWGTAALLLGAATHLPGAAGRSALRVLRRVLPAALRPILIAGVGVTVGVAITGCGDGTSGGPERSEPAAVAEQLTEPAMAARVAAPAGDAAARADAAINPATQGRVAVDLDWPTATGAAPRARAVLTLPELDWPASTAPVPRPVADPPKHSAAPKPPGAARPHPRPASVPVLVRPGDTLWAIAAAHLPTDADDALIDRTWRAWYAANTTVIGADPNLIQPGQQLRPPTAKDAP